MDEEVWAAMAELWERTTVREPARELAVIHRTDVLVAGGGPTGIAAALAVARTGAQVTLVERYGFLGGLWTAGLVNPILDYRDKGGIVEELMERLRAMSMITPQARFDPEAMKVLLDRMLLAAGVDIRLHRLVVDALREGDRVYGLITESKSGREALLAKVVVDCTGDGDVCARAGVPYTKGREPDGAMQALTTFFMLANVRYVQEGSTQVYDLLKAASDRDDLGYTVPYAKPSFFQMPQEGVAIVQLAHQCGYDGTNADDLTRAEIEGREQVQEAVRVMQHAPELRGVQLVATAPQVGVRETRHVHGRYRLTEEDLIAGRRFEDGICLVRFNFDVHGPFPNPATGAVEIAGGKAQPYQVPYRCLLPANRENLLMAGNCVSATSRAHSSLRVTGDCLAMGQAAGTAAALAVRAGVPPSALDPGLLVAQLERDGARVGG